MGSIHFSSRTLFQTSCFSEIDGDELSVNNRREPGTGKTGTDHLVDIDKVILSERRKEVTVQPEWLEVPLGIDLGKAMENRLAA